MSNPIRIANCSGFFGDRLSRGTRDGRGRPHRRPDRGLAGRVDHAHPVEGPTARSLPRVGAHLPDPDGRGPGHLRRPRDQGGHQRRRSQPGRPGRRGPALAERLGLGRLGGPRRGRRPAAPHRRAAGGRPRPGPPRHRAPLAEAAGPGGDGQRLPRGLAHRRGAARRGRRGHLPPGHRRLAGRRSGGMAPRLGRRPTGTAWPARWWPATSSSAAPRRPGATTPSSPRCPGSSTRGSRSPRWPTTAHRSSPSTPVPAAQVSVGTVTAQLLYEIAGPDYPNTDVVARFDTIQLEQEAPDRVRVSGTRGPAGTRGREGVRSTCWADGATR